MDRKKLKTFLDIVRDMSNIVNIVIEEGVVIISVIDLSCVSLAFIRTMYNDPSIQMDVSVSINELYCVIKSIEDDIVSFKDIDNNILVEGEDTYYLQSITNSDKIDFISHADNIVENNIPDFKLSKLLLDKLYNVKEVFNIDSVKFENDKIITKCLVKDMGINIGKTVELSCKYINYLRVNSIKFYDVYVNEEGPTLFYNGDNGVFIFISPRITI